MGPAEVNVDQWFKWTLIDGWDEARNLNIFLLRDIRCPELRMY